jgi:ribosomal protein S18 acetylase RimI-like enzyme
LHRVAVEAIDHRERAMAERIHAIHVAAYSQEAKLLGAVSFPPLERTVADIAAAQARYVGAYLDETLVGVIALEGESATAAVLISSLVVLPSFQRMGVARALLTTVMNEVPSRSLTVSTGSHNAPALALYKQSGFVEVRRYLVGAERLPMVELCRRP